MRVGDIVETVAVPTVMQLETICQLRERLDVDLAGGPDARDVQEPWAGGPRAELRTVLCDYVLDESNGNGGGGNGDGSTAEALRTVLESVCGPRDGSADAASPGAGLLIDGVHGSGKTHLLSVLALVWTTPVKLTPRDQSLNFSSPGNIIRYDGRWVICLQTYPTPNGEVHANDTARIWIMRSDDLETWGEPELLRVKGLDMARKDIGRMIDPYLVEDKDEPGKWWCFYKQKGVSMSYSRDLSTWTYVGHTESGENVCVLVEDDEYVLFHSPSNGVGVMRSKDLQTWERDEELITLGQKEWPWAQGRLTAGFVLDLRNEARFGKYIMFFHGSSKEGKKMWSSHGHASLGIAWSEDLKHWEGPK